MNYSLAREIYGNTIWMVDGQSLPSLLNMLSDFRNGVKYEEGAEKLNSSFIFDVLSGVNSQITPRGSSNSDSNELISVINLNGVITKNGGQSSHGTKQISQLLLQNDANPNVIGHIILTDTGGGSQSGMEVLTHALTLVTKPKASLIERGGMAGSAGYGIISFTDRIFAESKDSIVGSLGSMASIAAHPNKAIDADGKKHITIYATKSTKKNQWVEEAINNDNYEFAINEMLDPANEGFLGNITTNRPNIIASQLDGSVYKAGDVIGSMVDEIGSFKDVVNYIKAESKTPKFKINSNNNTNNKAMTASEFKTQHPAAHQEIFGAGVLAGITAEKDRVGSWLAHASTDLEGVKAGITGGGKITATAREEFLVKASSKNKLEALKSESNKDVVTPESEGEAVVTEADAFYADILKEME